MLNAPSNASFDRFHCSTRETGLGGTHGNTQQFHIHEIGRSLQDSSKVSRHLQASAKKRVRKDKMDMVREPLLLFVPHFQELVGRVASFSRCYRECNGTRLDKVTPKLN